MYEEEDEEEDACPVTMWFAWHMHTHQEEEEEEEEIEQTPEEQALFEAAQEGNTTTVVALLEAGTNANCRDEVCVCVCV